ERGELKTESELERSGKPSKPVNLDNTSVFVVHGRDNEAKHEVARLLERLKLKPIVLHEQPSRGKTIIEKIEHYSGVAFAVVILSPDTVIACRPFPAARARRAKERNAKLNRSSRLTHLRMPPRFLSLPLAQSSSIVLLLRAALTPDMCCKACADWCNLA